ncbi:hypothetical protein LEP1GSC123_3150 [Leptospira borgpetersenii str. 200701203]|uniref:Uncharacterized protein n=1 Tax=Leptospira borgpetersenii str. 200701203 TaxID=1193007 RepID=M3GVM0_LEPBO|nr:hypothetical protein LEP1GSC123_3150 [Leptospira borgpetersenii str. 200701203]
MFFPQDLIEFKNPVSIFFYQKGNGPVTIPWNTSGNTFYVVSHSTEGMIFLEYESFSLRFVYEYSKKGMEYTELIQEILSYRGDAFLPEVSFSAEKVSIDVRKRFGTYCYRY